VSRSRIYDETATVARRPAPVGARDDRELIRLATLAASSHNTQPWLFRAAPDAITIMPDRTRRCPVVDPHDAHLYKSLGCAAENLVHAASTQQLSAEVHYDHDSDAVVVELEETPEATPTQLSQALTTRQSTKTNYDGTPINGQDLAALTEAGSGDRARVLLLTDVDRIATVADLVEQGNLAQLNDRPFRRELVSWIRFNPRAALRTHDGLAGRVNRQPPLPTPIGRLLTRVLISAPEQAKTDTERIRSSAGVALFVTDTDGEQDWIDSGRAYERFSLLADLLGIRTAFINQPIEVPQLRETLPSSLSVEGCPQLMIRYGRAPRMPYSLRRPTDEVILSQRPDEGLPGGPRRAT
jgi:hypothetical protein